MHPINEMFQTLQGEGYFTGVPAISLFVYRMPVAAPGVPNNVDKLADGKCRCSAFWRNQRER